MFDLHRFKLHKHLVDGTVNLSGLGRFLVYTGFGLDCIYIIMMFNNEVRICYLSSSKLSNTVKPACAVTSVKQSPVIKGHLFLVLS